MMTFVDEVQIIDNAMSILVTGNKLTSENGTLMKSFKVINKAIKLHSIEVDMALLMVSKLFQTTNTHLDSGRVVNLLRDDDIGKHLISLLDNYYWSYNGLMRSQDFQCEKLIHKKIYNTPEKRSVCTGFTKQDDINSFIVREYIKS